MSLIKGVNLAGHSAWYPHLNLCCSLLPITYKATPMKILGGGGLTLNLCGKKKTLTKKIDTARGRIKEKMKTSRKLMTSYSLIW